HDDGTVEVRTKLPDGVELKETTTADGETTTTVIVDGEEVTLADSQEPTKEGSQPLINNFIAGKSLDDIAEERELTREQVIAQLQGAGYEVAPTPPDCGNGDTETTTITDSETGDKTTYTEEVHDNSLPEGVQGPVAPSYTVTTVETTDGETGATTKTVTNSQTNTTVETKTDENGRVTETTTQIGADGKESTTTVVTANGYTLTTGP